jgi:tetratricopeptide (TPR) repeat protein
VKPGKRIFITLPGDSLGAGENHDVRCFHFDPAIPLPVELPPGSGEFKAEDLNGEMILSGILWELAENPGGGHAAYYRNLAAEIKPGIFNELTEAAILKAKNGDHKTALDILSLLEGLCPRRPLLLLNRALVLEEYAFSLKNRAGGGGPAADEYVRAAEDAESAYESALASPLPDTLFYAGLFYHRSSDYGRAADCFAAYLEGESGNDPESAEKYSKAGELLDEIRKNSLDNESFKEALDLIRRGEEEQGILKARDFLERQPGAGNGWFLLGWGLRRLGRWEDGAACFEKALELGAANADALNELAICRMELNCFDEARRLLVKALYKEPDNIRFISNMGILALKQGRDDEAAAFFRTVLELEPDDPIAKAWIGEK